MNGYLVKHLRRTRTVHPPTAVTERALSAPELEADVQHVRTTEQAKLNRERQSALDKIREMILHD